MELRAPVHSAPNIGDNTTRAARVDGRRSINARTGNPPPVTSSRRWVMVGHSVCDTRSNAADMCAADGGR